MIFDSLFFLIVLGHFRHRSHKMVTEVLLNADNKQKLHTNVRALCVLQG